MVIFKMLIFTLLILVLIPVVKLGAAIFRAYRHVKRQTAAFAGNNRTYDTERGDTGNTSGYSGSAKRRRGRRGYSRKIFRSDEGEYVRFEEIEVDVTQEQERRRNLGNTTFRMEEQVSDAEWTDL
ncbi:MAG: DUF4834 family protein [Muribaculum sp.]|nr:DUF4834 family protein [Muribaculum sp.]